MFAAIAGEREAYAHAFGVAPTFRVGIHGGDVIVSEQGDAKRSIGIYGDAINIAARLRILAGLSVDARTPASATTQCCGARCSIAVGC
jgi:class 3 adenylate cyclase